MAIFLCVIVSAGCSREPLPNASDPDKNEGVEDGGTVKNADRDEVEAFFVALTNVRPIPEEQQLLTEFGQWLDVKNDKLRVQAKDGKHHLSCPYFPPDTPWISHSFLEIRNLELLPRLDNNLLHAEARVLQPMLFAAARELRR